MKLMPTPFQPSQQLSEDAALFKYNELHSKFGVNKILLAPYEMPIITALSFYPELKNIRIEFKGVRSDLPLNTKPAGTTIFKDPHHRTYVIHIATHIKNGREDVMLAHLNFNIQVGVIAHELGHVVDYLKKSVWEILATGLLYKSKNYKAKLESKVDTITAQHGLGYQLMEYGKLIKKLQNKYPADEYYKTYFDFYLKPEYIKGLIKVLPAYST